MPLSIDELRRLKEQKGYTIAKLSDYSGVPLGTLQKILNGETKQPRRATLDAIEKVLLSEELEYTGKSFYYAERSLLKAKLGEPESRYGLDGTGALRGALDIAALSGELKKQGFAKIPYGGYTVADYHGLPDEVRVELIDGVFYDMSAPSNLHQEIQMAISASLYYQIKQRKGTCKVLTAPTDVHIKQDDRNMVQPDIFIVCDQGKITYDAIEGSPDFILEIISPSTKKKDMMTKLQLYLDSGVREYWILDSIEQKVLVYRLEEEQLIPQILMLSGTTGIGIYKGEIAIDLNEIGQIVEEYERKKK